MDCSQIFYTCLDIFRHVRIGITSNEFISEFIFTRKSSIITPMSAMIYEAPLTNDQISVDGCEQL